MQLVIIVLIGGLSMYFLLAALLPGWRIRWGRMTLYSFDRHRIAKKHYRKPRMGGLSCFGLGLFLAAFPILYFGVSSTAIPTVAFLTLFTGFVLGLIGQSRDKALEGQGWERDESRKNEG